MTSYGHNRLKPVQKHRLREREGEREADRLRERERERERESRAPRQTETESQRKLGRVGTRSVKLKQQVTSKKTARQQGA